MCLAPLLDSHTVTNRLSEHYDWYQQNKLNKRQAWTGCYSIFFLLCITVDLTPLPPHDWLMYFLPQGSPHVNQYMNSRVSNVYPLHDLVVGRGGVMMVTLVFFSSPPTSGWSGGHFIFFPGWREEQIYHSQFSTITKSYIFFQYIAYQMQSLVPACSNMSNNFQQLPSPTFQPAPTYPN